MIISRILEVKYDTLVLFMGVFCFAAFFAALIHIEIGRRATKYLTAVNYRILSGVVFAFILALVYYFTGWLGLLISLVSIAIGLLPILSGVSRTHLMGVLLVPTILFFLGLG